MPPTPGDVLGHPVNSSFRDTPGISELWSLLGGPVGESGEKTALGKECAKGHHPAVPIWASIITIYGHDQVLAEVLPFSTGALDREDGQGVRSSLPGCVEDRGPVRPRHSRFGEPFVEYVGLRHSWATPIMASLVTSPASSSSGSPSLPSGRIGSTR